MHWIADEANLLSKETEQLIESYNDKWDSAYRALIAVVAVDDIQGWKAEDYTYTLGNEWGLGANDMLLLVAKNDRAHVSLSEQIKAHTVHRAYMAIVQGGMREDRGTVEGPIGRHPTDRKKMAIVPDGRDAMTHWKVLESLKGATLLECRLTTGRTHQIRVHMTSIGHPLLGDPLYGPKKMPYPVHGGQLLHAFRIGFVHPRTGEEMLFEAPPEARFLEWQRKLQK
jgi:23S rRNA pseudouridine1911/1915/1917 synthase